MKEPMNFLLIDNERVYKQFVEENQGISWIGMDTEFIGEKRYFTSLCLIQVSTQNGNYIFDPMSYRDIVYFEELICSPEVVVITHAGSNDYKLLYQEFGIKPANTFDLQIAVAFLGFPYPVSFKFIAETFLDVHLPKSHTVTNWEKRPISSSMARYAVQDVEYLGELYEILSKQLIEVNRLQWCLDECSKFTQDSYYEKVPYPELNNNSFFRKLRDRERVVYLKLLDWRLSEAIKANKPKEAILPIKTLNVLARMHHMSINHLRDDRRVNPRVFDMYKRKMIDFIEKTNGVYEDKLKALNIINHRPETPQEINVDLLYELIKLRCKTSGVAPEIVLTKKTVRTLLNGPSENPLEHESGWRKELLGPKLLEWIDDPLKMQIQYEDENERFIIF